MDEGGEACGKLCTTDVGSSISSVPQQDRTELDPDVRGDSESKFVFDDPQSYTPFKQRCAASTNRSNTISQPRRLPKHESSCNPRSEAPKKTEHKTRVREGECMTTYLHAPSKDATGLHVPLHTSLLNLPHHRPSFSPFSPPSYC